MWGEVKEKERKNGRKKGRNGASPLDKGLLDPPVFFVVAGVGGGGSFCVLHGVGGGGGVCVFAGVGGRGGGVRMLRTPPANNS